MIKDRAIRLLMVDQYGEIGGGQRCFLEAAEGFRARRWELHAAVPSRGPLTDELQRRGVRVHPLACGPFTATRKSPFDAARLAGQLPRQVAQLRRILAEHAIDAIYVNGAQVMPAAALTRGALPVLFHVHWVVTQRIAAKLAHWAIRQSRARIIATSEFVARSVRHIVPVERIRVIYNGVRSAERMPRPAEPPRHVAILGRIAPEKGQLEFVRAARVVLSKAPWLQFTVRGAPMFSESGYLERVRQEAKGSPIEFPGWVDDVPAWLSNVDLLVVASHESDNIPRVIMEAFAAEVPVIAFASGGIPELIEDGVTGMLVKERTHLALANAIWHAVESPEQLVAMTREARRRFERQYSLERFQSEVCDAVEEAVRPSHQRIPSLSAGNKAEA